MKQLKILVPLFAIFSVACASNQPSNVEHPSAQIAAGAGCAQLDDDKTLARLYSPGVIYDAQPVTQKIFRMRASQPTRTVGASLYVRAEPGMSAPYMRRVLACHVVSDESAHPNDPLHPNQGEIASLEVREARGGFAIDVIAEKPSVGQEIWRRAESLTERGGSVTVEQLGAKSGPSSHL